MPASTSIPDVILLFDNQFIVFGLSLIVQSLPGIDFHAVRVVVIKHIVPSKNVYIVPSKNVTHPGGQGIKTARA
jgi:hypothetical protein